jgi:hypothetical protein
MTHSNLVIGILETSDMNISDQFEHLNSVKSPLKNLYANRSGFHQGLIESEQSLKGSQLFKSADLPCRGTYLFSPAMLRENLSQ